MCSQWIQTLWFHRHTYKMILQHFPSADPNDNAGSTHFCMAKLYR